MPMQPDGLREALTILGEILEDRGHHFELVLVGGGALNLVGLIRRPTKDLDVVARIEDQAWVSATPLPSALLSAVNDVALALNLAHDWLNAGPADLFHMGLPAGFAERTTREEFGGLTIHLASRVDQVAFKLYAAADRWPSNSRHLQDLRALAPTREELIASALWCQTHDVSEGFRDVLLRPVLAEFGIDEVPRE